MGPGGVGGAERVQFQDLARQVLVQAGQARRAGGIGGAPFAGGRLTALRQALHDARVGPRRQVIVEVAQHGRVRGAGAQQVGEAACDVRADGLALEGADDAAHGALAQRHGEVVAPEHRQPFGEGARGARSGGKARALVGAHAGAQGLFVALGPAADRRGLQTQAGGGVGQSVRATGIGDWLLRVGRADLRPQPAGRVVADDGQIGLAEAETVGSEGGSRDGHRWPAGRLAASIAPRVLARRAGCAKK
jgi:hypothetical protein